MQQAQEKITEQLQQWIQYWFQQRFVNISDLPLFTSIGFVGEFDLVPFALGPELIPIGGTGETQLLSVETFGEAIEGLDLFGDGDEGLPEGGDMEGLTGGGDDDLAIRGFPK